ncbi:hypothetical protein HYY75_04065, partial [bacterium]|nr:hypothetical protein [bacterium]
MGNFLYEAPVTGARNDNHPVMCHVQAIGAWAGSTFSIVPTDGAKAENLLESRFKKAPYILASEVGKGRVVAIGDSSPFDDGVGSGAKKMLHDSYDSFLFSHPQFAFNTLKWITKQPTGKVIPSRQVPLAKDAKIDEKSVNLLIDASHGNAASDKMETFERHMVKVGVKVFYNVNIINQEMLKKFKVLILPDPSLPLLDAEK